MSATEVLNMARTEGVTLELVGVRLTWKADHQPPVELLERIKAHRLEIIEALSATNDCDPLSGFPMIRAAMGDAGRQPFEPIPMPPVPAEPPPEALAWLARVARLLGCSLDHLLARGFIDRHDLAKQYRTHPRLAARLIRSHPDWSPPEPPAIERSDAGQPQQVHHSAASASSEWRQARNQFINHLMPCRACHAATGRYCVTGAALRQRYDQIPMGSAP